MKRIIGIIGIILVLVTPIHAGDWTREDTYRELTFQGLLVVDYLQTRTIVRNPDKYFEYNPIIGKHPNQKNVDIYMVSCAIIHPVVSYYLPPKYRKVWQYVTIGIEAGAVGNNLRIGVSF